MKRPVYIWTHLSQDTSLWTQQRRQASYKTQTVSWPRVSPPTSHNDTAASSRSVIITRTLNKIQPGYPYNKNLPSLTISDCLHNYHVVTGIINHQAGRRSLLDLSEP